MNQVRCGLSNIPMPLSTSLGSNPISRLTGRAAWLLLPLLVIPAALPAQSIAVSVDASQKIRQVDERVFGVNAVMWDGQTGTAQTAALLQAAGIRAIRIPGGSASDEYHWKTNTSLANTWNWMAGFDSFSRLITSLNSQTFVTVNYGTGTPEEAAAWVAYANASATLAGTSSDVTLGTDADGVDWKTAGYWSGVRATAPLGTNDGSNFLRASRATPYALRYWEIGNECYGSWESDAHPAQWDPVTYANEAKAYIAKMKAVDPAIKIGVVAETGEDSLDGKSPVHNVTNPRTGVAHHGWTPVMLATLKSLGVPPDFLIYHRYEQAPGQESDATLLQKATTWPKDAADLRQQLTDYLGTAGANVELVVTENNSVYSGPGKQTTSLVNGLYLADSIGNVLQTEFNALVWWDLRNGQDNANNNSASLYGWRSYGDYGILSSPASFSGGSTTAYEAYPTYYVMKLLANFAHGGDSVVHATSGNVLLAVFAVLRADGSLSLLVINKDPSATQSASIALTGFTPAATGAVYSYGVPQDNAAKPAGTGSADVATSSLTVSGQTFSASFAPYSATVISIAAGTTPPPTPPTTPTPTPAPSGGGGGGGAPTVWFLGALVVLGISRRLQRG